MNKQIRIKLGSHQYDIEELLSETKSYIPEEYCCDDCILEGLEACVSELSDEGDTEEQKELAFQRLLGGFIIYRRTRNRIQLQGSK